MAKRYFSFNEVQEGKNKPYGTLGSHHYVAVTQNLTTKVVTGSISGVVTLHSGDTLGYDCGSVWVVPRPESYKDPIRRVLATYKIPQKALIYSGQQVTYFRSRREKPIGSSCDTDEGESLLGVMGEYESGMVPDSDYVVDRPGYERGRSSMEYVNGGNVIVIQKVFGYNPNTTDQNRRVSQIVVRPSVDKTEVAEFLLGLLKNK